MNFEDVTQKMVKLGKDTMAEVQKLNRIRQLNSKASSEKKKINSLYLEMGKKLYNLYRDTPLEGFEPEIRTISEKMCMIDLLQDQVRAVKGVVLCPCCNTEVPESALTCPKCGTKLPGLKVQEDTDRTEEVMETVEEADIPTEAADTAAEAAEPAEETDTAAEAAEPAEDTDTAAEAAKPAEETDTAAEAAEPDEAADTADIPEKKDTEEIRSFV